MGNRKGIKRKRVIGLLAASLFFSAAPATALASSDNGTLENVTVSVDGKESVLKDPARIVEGRLFLPAAPLAEIFGATVEWDPENETMTLHTINEDIIVVSNGVPVVYFNDKRYVMDVSPFLEEGRTYIPIRHVAGLLGANVVWQKDDSTAILTLAQSAEEIIAEMLTEAEPYTEEDLLLLAKLVQVEAGYESYEGQLAVANVILNRVQDPRFPDTIRDVIYSGKQFPPAHNGLLDKSEPNASSLRAAKDALNGKNNVEGAVYFYNPKVTKGSFWNSLDVVAKIGNHHFAF